jgi:hypothetical protein
MSVLVFDRNVRRIRYLERKFSEKMLMTLIYFVPITILVVLLCVIADR